MVHDDASELDISVLRLCAGTGFAGAEWRCGGSGSDRRAYVGRTDGTFFAVDLDTARVNYFLRTGGTGFGPTLQADGYVVIQGSAELFVVQEPGR